MFRINLLAPILGVLLACSTVTAWAASSAIDELKASYEAAVAQSGKMSEAANEIREELIDEYWDDKGFVKALPYVRDTWAWYEQEGIKGQRKGRLRARFAKALHVAGLYLEAEPLAKESCERTVEKKGEQSRPAINRCTVYGIVLSALGKYDEAIELLENNLAYAENTFGETHGKTAWVHVQLGGAYHRADNFEKARKNLKTGLELFLSKKGGKSRITNVARLKLAKLFHSFGELDKAERILRRAYTDFATKPENQEHQLAAHLMTHLGRTLMLQGRYVEAEALLKEGVEKKIALLGPASQKTVQTMLTLANIYLDQYKYREAEQVLQQIASTPGAVEDNSRLGVRRNILLGRTYIQLGKLDEAEQTYARIKAYMDTTRVPKYQEKGYYQGLARVHFRKGRHAEAVPLYKRAIALSEELYGKASPKTSYVKSQAAQNFAKAKKFPEAVALYREVMVGNADFLAKRQTNSTSGRVQQEKATQAYLLSYMKLMVNAYLNKTPVDAEPVAESFAIAENSRSKTLQAAMLGQTARAAARNDYLSELVRKEQDLRVQLGKVEEDLIAFIGSETKGDGRLGKRLESKRRELTKELKAIGEEMSYQYPEYHNLINPKAASLAEVQERLVDGELMLAYFVEDDRTIGWAIDNKTATMFTSDKLNANGLYARVQKLRSALDVPVATLEDIPRYDLDIAHEIYTELVAPAGKQLDKANSLIIVPHKALLSMPIGALVSSKYKLQKNNLPFAEYRGAPWLARQYAISIMPSATALLTMRRYAKKEKAEEPFIGFGDPLFGPFDDTADEDISTRGVKVAQRAAINTRNLASLPNLPETRNELKQIALTLGAADDKLFLGKQASEVNVKHTNLKDYRVVAFATHGLVAGDLDGLEQPALALTPPEQGTDEDDGLLQMGEVLGLDMNADWVVLSACNTASGDKSLANEGLTGLTQAFFYAGSKALLVSLWPVESTSTQLLTTSMFEATKTNAEVGRANALQAARKRLIDGQGFMQNGKEIFSYAHPIFWSAFIAVGEGGK